MQLFQTDKIFLNQIFIGLKICLKSEELRSTPIWCLMFTSGDWLDSTGTSNKNILAALTNRWYMTLMKPYHTILHHATLHQTTYHCSTAHQTTPHHTISHHTTCYITSYKLVSVFCSKYIPILWNRYFYISVIHSKKKVPFFFFQMLKLQEFSAHGAIMTIFGDNYFLWAISIPMNVCHGCGTSRWIHNFIWSEFQIIVL